MQTCTAMQLPTSRLQIKNLKLNLLKPYLKEFFFFYIQNVLCVCCCMCVPQADIVLHCKLDPIHNLRKLWYHGQQCDTNKVLQHTHTQLLSNETAYRSKTETFRVFFLLFIKVFQVPGRWRNWSAGAGCSPCWDQHNMPSSLWQLSALPELSTGTSELRDDLLRHSLLNI